MTESVLDSEPQFHKLFPHATEAEEMAEDFITEAAVLWRFKQMQMLLEQALSKEELAHADLKTLTRFLKADPAYKLIGTCMERTQDDLWRLQSEIVSRQLDRLNRIYATRPEVGRLKLNPNFLVPRDQTTVDIHRMPGGYWRETNKSDIFAGALYDRGVYVYAGKRWGSLNDLFGKTLISKIEPLSDNRPVKILDLGCSVGHSTLPYVEKYPHAEVYGIDVAAPMLRYAHARAAYLGRAVHFIQADATKTGFEAGSFDLVVSHILFHEMPLAKIGKLFAECRRLLKPGGVMAHVDLRPFRSVGQYPPLSLPQCLSANLDTWHNNEPYWQAVRSANLMELASKYFDNAELAEDLIAPAGAPSIDPARMWYYLTGIKTL